LERAALESAAIAGGVNTFRGHITCAAVAESQGKPWRDLKSLL